jgi:hypothetical protein
LSARTFLHVLLIHLSCPDCGGTLRVIACIEDLPLIAKILGHVRSHEAVAQNESGLNEQFLLPIYTPLHSDPRWALFLERAGSSAE